MTQYVLDCPKDSAGNVTCTIVPYSPPPETVTEYALAPGWMFGMLGVLLFVAVVAAAIIRYHRIEERTPTRADRRLDAKKAELDAKARIAEAHNSCQNCGVRYSPKLEDIGT